MGYSLGNGFMRPLWGSIFDIYGFKIPFIILNLIEIIISCSIYFIVDNTILFSIMILTCGCLHAGIFALFPSFVSKVFGIR